MGLGWKEWDSAERFHFHAKRHKIMIWKANRLGFKYSIYLWIFRHIFGCYIHLYSYDKCFTCLFQFFWKIRSDQNIFVNLVIINITPTLRRIWIDEQQVCYVENLQLDANHADFTKPFDRERHRTLDIPLIIRIVFLVKNVRCIF